MFRAVLALLFRFRKALSPGAALAVLPLKLSAPFAHLFASPVLSSPMFPRILLFAFSRFFGLFAFLVLAGVLLLFPALSPAAFFFLLFGKMFLQRFFAFILLLPP